MNRATRIVASSFGAFAAIGAIEHGIFEIMQGNVAPAGVMISSMGPPCVPAEIWNACEPAMTILPNLLLTGIAAVVLGVIAMVWSLFFIARPHGGLVLLLLSLAMLLFGGGIFPPLIGMAGGAMGARINAPIAWWRRRFSGGAGRFLAALWPWTVIVFLVGLLGQFVVGHFFNDFLLQNGALILVLIPLLLVVTVLSAFAWDVQRMQAADDGDR
jgi:hypothetical protein